MQINNFRRNLFLSFPAVLIFPNFAGLLLLIVVFLLLNYGLPVLRNFDDSKKQSFTRQNVCEFIDLFLLGTNAGLTKLETLNLINETASIAVQNVVTQAIARCNLGISLSTSLSYVAGQYPGLRSSIRVISRSELTGAPIIEALELELMLNRAQASNEVLRLVRSLSVKCVLPLGLCFLPAFFLITIVPIVASLLPNMFSAFH